MIIPRAAMFLFYYLRQLNSSPQVIQLRKKNIAALINYSIYFLPKLIIEAG
jgi:hypothetical protein